MTERAACQVIASAVMAAAVVTGAAGTLLSETVVRSDKKCTAKLDRHGAGLGGARSG